MKTRIKKSITLSVLTVFLLVMTPCSVFSTETPAVTGIDPYYGPPDGGTEVTITGTNLDTVTAVYFGETPAASFTLVDAALMTAVSPAGTGSVHILVHGTGGLSPINPPNDVFSYGPEWLPPEVDEIRDTDMIITGSGNIIGSEITIRLNGESNFLTGGPVGEDGRFCAALNSPLPAGTELEVFARNGIGAMSGIREVTVVPTPSGTVVNLVVKINGNLISPVVPYREIDGVVLGHLSTVVGALGAETSYNCDSQQRTISTPGKVLVMTINRTACTLNGNPCSCPVSPSIIQGHSMIPLQFVVESLGGEINIEPGPDISVTALYPNYGSALGGTVVTITGTNLDTVTAVYFGDTPAYRFTLGDESSMTAVSPAGNGTVNVTVVSPDGASLASAGSRFTYYSPLYLFNGKVFINGTELINLDVPLLEVDGVVMGPPRCIHDELGAAAAWDVETQQIIFTLQDTVLVMPINSTTATLNGSPVEMPVPPTVIYGRTMIPLQFVVEALGGTFLIVEAPTIDSVTPSSGPGGGDTTVAISGTGLSTVSAVYFGIFPATNLSIISDTLINAVSPAGSGTVHVTVAGLGGTSTTSENDQFTYISSPSAPTVTSIDPNHGPPAGDTEVTITGTNLDTVTAVYFGNTSAASFALVDAAFMTAVSPAGTGTVNVTVVSPDGVSSAGSSCLFTYDPAAVPIDCRVVVNGIEILHDASFYEVDGVLVGSARYITEALGIVSTSWNTETQEITLTSANKVLVMTLNSSTAYLNGSPVEMPVPPIIIDDRTMIPLQFVVEAFGGTFFVGEAPTITSVSPSNGPGGGGTSVTISGTGLSTVDAVYFGIFPVTDLSIISATSITAVSPAGSGTVHVTLTGRGGPSALSGDDQFTYITSPSTPAVTGIDPNHGPADGGTEVTITGSNLETITAVYFGATPAASFTLGDAASMTAVSPAGTGMVNVTVVSPEGASATSAGSWFTYDSTPVQINCRVFINGTEVLTDTPFYEVDGVVVGAVRGVLGPLFLTSQWNSETQEITLTSLSLDNELVMTLNSSTAYLNGSPVEMPVPPIIIDGRTMIPLQFVVEALGGTIVIYRTPVITNVSPDHGPEAGGTAVTITGANLTSVTAVRFGSAPAAGFTLDSPTSITAVAPPGTGTVEISVISPVLQTVWQFYSYSVPVTGNTTVNDSNKHLEITGTTPDTTITIPSGVTDATVNVGTLLNPPAGGTVTSDPLPALNISTTTSLSADLVQVSIPSGATVSALEDDKWDGTIHVPTVQANSSVTVTPDSGKTAAVSKVIEIGFGDVPLTFSQAVRILIPGQAGKDVGYSRGGVFTKITNVMTDDSQAAGDALPIGGDGRIDVGSDLIIWTKHFSQFVTYTQTAVPGGGGPSGGGSAPPSTQPETEPIEVPAEEDVNVPLTEPNDLAGHWARDSILSLFQRGIISGYPDGSFRPDDKITRAEFAALLVRAFNLSAQSGRVFNDTAIHWAKLDIAAAEANGIVSGYNETSFGPDDLITREQMAVMAARAANLAPLNEATSFSDNQSISPWAINWVSAAVSKEIIHGCDNNTFKPQDAATRAEAVTVIVNSLK